MPYKRKHKHKWERVSTRIINGMVNGQVDQCRICGTLRTIRDQWPSITDELDKIAPPSVQE